jgi:hypothetical protein
LSSACNIGRGDRSSSGTRVSFFAPAGLRFLADNGIDGESGREEAIVFGKIYTVAFPFTALGTTPSMRILRVQHNRSH